MAYNPFLSMNEPAAPVAADVLNPFMMADSAASEPVDFGGDNPFAASNNPFSDFGGFEPAAGDTVPVDIFGGPDPPGGGARQFDGFNITSAADDIFGQENEKMVKPTDLDLISTTADNFNSPLENRAPSRPLPPETQHLILSVTGQMEFTSSHLLDRIPPTRTPSPVSARDIHSPSPTPEPELEMDPEPVLPATSPVPAPPAPVPVPTAAPSRAKPTRPPPARPPPAARPPPPRPAPPPVPVAAAPHDDINLFDAPPAPAVVKPTMQDIMSLYSAPKKEEERQIDFLSDDISEDIPASVGNEPPAPQSVPSPHDVLGEAVTSPKAATEATAPGAVPAGVDSVTPMDCSEELAAVPEFTALSSNNSPFADINDDQFGDQIVECDKNPFENAGPDESADVFSSPATNIFGIPEEDTFMSPNRELGMPTDDVLTAGPDSTEPFPTESFPTKQFPAPLSTGEHTMTSYFDSGAADAFGASDAPEAMMQDAFPESQDAFDAFSAKFDSAPAKHVNSAAWGDEGSSENAGSGFEAEAFDPFLSMGAPPPPAATPRRTSRGSNDSGDDTFSVFIRPKETEGHSDDAVPALAPPPRPPTLQDSPRENPFDKSFVDPPHLQQHIVDQSRRMSGGSGGETPPTPLFDEDMSMPLEDFPRTKYAGPGWEMQLRQPNKKKITGQRFWKKIFVRLIYQGDNPAVQLYNAQGDKEPFQELPLQACYSVSEVGAQQFDQFGKIFTVKLQYVFYKERPGVRPGQVTKAERITNKLSQFAAYAIQGDYQGVKEFGSDLRKLGLPVEHAPQVSQLFKLGSLNYEDVKQFSCCIEEALFRLPAHRDRALTYKMEEVQITAVDELYVEQDAEGSVLKQIARVRLFFLGFLSGMPDVELGVNDLRRQGKEVVGRHDIIPVVTEEWIRVEDVEFHACVQPQDFHDTKIIKFKPPDACYIELMRFRVRPPKNRELPLQLKAVWCVTGNKVELRADVLVPGFASRKLGQVPCEDVSIRFPIPECWIYLFRVEKHFRYGSVKSAHRRTGKIKGIERFLGAVDTLQESLIEVTSGQAKYEHQHRAIVWRMPRLPKEGQGAYTTHNLVCRMALTSYDQVPAELAKFALVEFTMPATQVSHMTVRSVSLQNHDNDPPEKYVRYLARHEYTVGIERTSGQSAPAYAIAASKETRAEPAPAPTPPTPAVPQPPSSDSDSD